MSPRGAPGKNASVEKPEFKPGEPTRIERVDLDPSERFAVVGSSHGDDLAQAEIYARLRAEGACWIFHSGDITGERVGATACVELAMGSRARAVQGNHDVLVVGRDQVHTYDDLVIRTAEATARVLTQAARDTLAGAPVKIETPWFSIVHESCDPPYYAKRSKRRRKSYGWDEGSSADENMAAVSFGRIDRPHFIGSDHAAFVIQSAPRLRMIRPRPGDMVEVPRRAIVSVPSICFSRDPDYDCGAVLGDVLPGGGLRLTFLSIAPARRADLFDFVPRRR